MTTEEENDPGENAAKMFYNGLPNFKTLVDNTKSKKGLARVIKAAVEFPLGDSEPKFTNHNEQLLFYLFQELVKHKQTIIMSIMHERMQEGKEDGEKELAENRDST